MGEPGRFSLERIVASVANRRVSFIAAVLALIAALALGREAISEIPEIVEAGYGYDAQLRATHLNRSLVTHSLPVTFVDVDDEALNAWADATRTTPRAKIAALIERLSAQHPSAIFVDFDLSGAMTSAGDTDLAKTLDTYPRNGPPLLLTRAMRSLTCPEGVCSASACAPATQSKLEASPFEETVSKNPKRSMGFEPLCRRRRWHRQKLAPLGASLQGGKDSGYPVAAARRARPCGAGASGRS